MGESTAQSPRFVGRYAIFDEIASGGMATVFIGRLIGSGGFTRTVAIKRLHPQFAKDPEFVTMFLDEARLAARIRHPNVVPTLDVVASKGEVFLVMEYVQGESLSRLARALKARGERVPLPILLRVMSDALQGLHAAHEARDERGVPLNIVHRDVTPQNILVGIDGVARLLDFGVAKAAGRAHTTREGQIKGKLSYMAPEQLMGLGVTRETDIYSAAVVLWEVLTGERLFSGSSEVDVVAKLLARDIKPPSSIVPDLPRALDDLVMKGLAPKVADRFASAREMCLALGQCALGEAPSIVVGEWVERTAEGALADRTAKIAKIESSSDARVPAIGNLTSSPPNASPPLDGTPTLPPPEDVSPKSERAPEALSITMSTGVIRMNTRVRAWGTAAGVAAVVLGVALASVRLSRRTGSEQAGAPAAAPSAAEVSKIPPPPLPAPAALETAAPGPSAAPSPAPSARRVDLPSAPAPARRPAATATQRVGGPSAPRPPGGGDVFNSRE
jgi:serine/threonine protein kinase